MNRTQPKFFSKLNLTMFCFSAIILAYEILLSRIFSVKYNYHFTFLAISTAIAGIGVGGFIYSFLKYDLESTKKLVLQFFVVYNILFIALIISNTIFNSVFFLPFLPLIAFISFGFFLAYAFSIKNVNSGVLYFWNLAGSAVGAWLIIFVIRLGAIPALLLFLISAIFLLGRITKKWVLGTLALLGIVLALSFIYPRFFFISINNTSRKEILNFIKNKTNLVKTYWSIFGRTELVKGSENVYVLFNDGTAGSSMYRFSGDYNNISYKNSPTLRPIFGYPGIVPFIFIPSDEKKNALSIGPGGGRDILLLKAGGVKNIDAVEVNPQISRVLKAYADFNGDISAAPNVKYYIEDGRTFIHHTKRKYNIIYMSLTMTNVARSLESFNLTESFLFTKEAMAEYYSKLEDNGYIIVVTHGLPELYKLIFLTMDALRNSGQNNKELFSEFYTFGTPMFPVFVLKKGSLTKAETGAIHNFVMKNNLFISGAFYAPGIRQMMHSLPPQAGRPPQDRAMINKLIYEMSQQGKNGKIDFSKIYRTAYYNIKPATDDQPYFYKFTKGLPFEILYILIFGLVLTVLFSVWRRKQGPRASTTDVFYFISIGIAFMLVEITLITKFTLLLGQPSLSFAVTLVSILLGAGVGSFIHGKSRFNNKLFVISIGILVFSVLLYAKILDPVIYSLLKSNLTIKVLAVFLLNLPISLPLGMPFPYALNILKKKKKNVIPRMIAINGAASILGSGFAIIIALFWGLHYNFFAAAILYALIIEMAILLRKNEDKG